MISGTEADHVPTFQGKS